MFHSNAIHLNCFWLDVRFDTIHCLVQLVGNLKFYADAAILMYLNMVYKLNQNCSCQPVDILKLLKYCQIRIFGVDDVLEVF